MSSGVSNLIEAASSTCEYLENLLPKQLVQVLYLEGSEAFRKIFNSDHSQDIFVEWNAALRSTLLSKLNEHLTSYLSQLAFEPTLSYVFAPIKINYVMSEQLNVCVEGVYLSNFLEMCREEPQALKNMKVDIFLYE